MNKIIIGLLIIASVLILGCAKQQVVGGDKDEHGCIGSAGYSWCEEKQKCLRTWEESCTVETEQVNADNHGCDINQGYVWCESQNKCIVAATDSCLVEEHVCTAEESSAQACTLEYAPVCGKIILNMGDTKYQTFGNGCSACAAMKVVSYVPGECSGNNSAD